MWKHQNCFQLNFSDLNNLELRFPTVTRVTNTLSCLQIVFWFFVFGTSEIFRDKCEKSKTWPERFMALHTSFLWGWRSKSSSFSSSDCVSNIWPEVKTQMETVHVWRETQITHSAVHRQHVDKCSASSDRINRMFIWHVISGKSF